MQRTRINLNYSFQKEIIFGVIQGSVLGLTVFNLFLCDLFMIMNGFDFVRQADDKTPYTMRNLMEEVIQELENASKILFKWFSDNQMKATPDKCHFLTGFNSEIGITVENQKITSTKL